MIEQGTQFYHGTKSEIPVGGLVRPAVEIGEGHTNWGDTGDHMGQPSKENAFASTDWGIAHDFSRGSADWHKTGLIGHVYRVEPVGEPRRGVHDGLNEYVAPAWRVVGPPEHTRPVHGGQYRQGRLPIDFSGVESHGYWRAADEVAEADKALFADPESKPAVQRAVIARDRREKASIAGREEEALPMRSRQFDVDPEKPAKQEHVAGQMELR